MGIVQNCVKALGTSSFAEVPVAVAYVGHDLTHDTTERPWGDLLNKSYHIVLSRPFDLDQFDRDSSANKCPRHAMSMLRHDLGAHVHQPTGRDITLVDRVWSVALAATPAQVALGRALARELTDQDAVFAAGEDVGYPLALALLSKSRRPRLVVEVHNPRTPRGRFALKCLNLAKTVDVFTVTMPSKAEFMQQHLKVPAERIVSMNQTTDPDFFTPGPPSPGKGRPIIAACGLEQRDYITLANATETMDVDVRICAASANVTSSRDSFPSVLPANMSARHYDWPELLQLYRDADVVAIPLRPNVLGAGQTALMEAMACQRPVVTTEADGMVRDFAADALLNTIPERDVDALREAIVALLHHPEQAAEQARRAGKRVVEQFNPERYVRQVTELLRG